MLLSRRLPTSSVIDLCRSLRHNLAAGLTLRDVFRQQARRGHAAVRPIAERVGARLEEGDSLADALEEDKQAFPPLFLALAGVGEETGHQPEVFGALEDYYLLQQRFWRQFWSQCTLPILQFIAAVGIIAGMLLVLGWLGSPMDPFGVGNGVSGALKFTVGAFAPVVVLFLVYKVMSRSLEQKALADTLLLRLPAVGPLVEALSLARFCMALHLTLDSGMSVVRALGLALRGTGNAAYARKTKVVQDALREGEPLTEALAAAHVFPDDFIHIVSVGEQGGRVPEIMRTQAKRYEEEATLRLQVLTRVASFGVWLVVAILIIIVIFRLASIYFGVINELAK